MTSAKVGGVLLIGAIFAIGCDREPSDGDQATLQIAEHIQRLPVGTTRKSVSFAELTDFEWSEVRITGPFSPYEFPMEFRRSDGGIERGELLEAGGDCFADLGWIPREKARFRVFVHRYRDDGSLYRLLIPAADVPGANVRKCLRENPP